MMNIGVYIPHLAKNQAVVDMAKMLNKAVQSNEVSDACVFYDSIGPNDQHCEFAIFNSTDIWNFTGKLITTTIETTAKAIKVGNKFSVFFYYGFEGKKDVLGLLSVANNEDVEIICRSEDDANELYRLTGKKTASVVENFDTKILEVIK